MRKACNLLETLPIKFGESPNISDEENNERLDVYLGKPNSPEMVQRLGHEKVKKISDQVHRADGEYGSWRYLYVVDGEYVGVLQGIKNKDTSILSTAFVKPEYRSKKIGSQLISIVKKQQNNHGNKGEFYVQSKAAY